MTFGEGVSVNGGAVIKDLAGNALDTSTAIFENWTEDLGAVQTPGPAVDAIETVVVTLSSSLFSGPRLFVRVRGSRN